MYNDDTLEPEHVVSHAMRPRALIQGACQDRSGQTQHGFVGDEGARPGYHDAD